MSKNPICICPKCGERSIFVEIGTVSKAGDNGYCSGRSYSCQKCGFVPFLLPKIEGYDEPASNS